MAEPRKLTRFSFANLRFPYDPSQNAVERQGTAIVGGENLDSTWRNDLRKRKGTSEFETTATTFTDNIKRLFWSKKWDGTLFVFANEVSATQSIVYKLKAGTDNSFVSIFTSSSAVPFDFVMSADIVFFGNGTDMRKYKYSGTTTFLWQPAKIATAPTTAEAGTGSFSAINGFRYVYCGGSTTTGCVTGRSDESITTGAFSGITSIDVTGGFFADSEIDEVHIFRTVDAHPSTKLYFELSNSPIANPGSGNWTIVDTDADTDLKTTRAPGAGRNDQPPAGRYCRWFANRLWIAVDDKLYYSEWEEAKIGLPEANFFLDPLSGNFFQFPGLLTGTGEASDALIVFTDDETFAINGESRTTLSRQRIAKNIGCGNHAAITSYRGKVFFFASDNQLRITDGVTVTEPVSREVTIDFNSLSVSNISLAAHAFGNKRWIIVADSSGGKWYILDLDSGQWLPPWGITAHSLIDAGTPAGERTLIFGAGSKKVLKYDETVDQDDGTNFFMRLLFSLTRIARLGNQNGLEYIVIDKTSAGALPTINYLMDDDPSNSGVTWRTTKLESNSMRDDGTALIQRLAYPDDGQASGGERVAVRITTTTENAAFILKGLGFGIEPRK